MRAPPGSRGSRVGPFATALVACDRATHGGPGDTGIALATTKDAKDSLIRLKDSLLAERSRQLSEQSQLLGDAATSARLAAQIERSLAEVRSLRDLVIAPENPIANF